MRHGHQRLHVVDRGGLAEQAGHRREGRLDARVAAAPLQRVHERRLLAADVGAGALVHVDVNGLARPHRVGAEDAGGICLLAGGLHLRQRLRVLAADVDVGHLGPDRIGADRAALDQRVRRPPHDLAILEGAGLRLVGVAAEVVGLAIAGLHEAPLHPRGEAGAAAPAQPGVLHDLDDLGRLHLERLLERDVAAALAPAVEADGLLLAEVLREHERLALMRCVRKAHVSRGRRGARAPCPASPTR